MREMMEFEVGTDTFRLGQLSGFMNDTEILGVTHSAYRKDAVKLPGKMRAWAGGLSWAEATARCIDGDMAMAAQSEKMLARIEDLLPPPTARHSIINDVTGSFPDVPAMLAGHPLAMRRKVKRDNEAAPIGIVLNLGASSNVPAAQMLQRGIAALALVRATEAIRPVELWVGGSTHRDMDNGCDGTGGTVNCYFQIPTTPMDLARAAHLIASPTTQRLFIHTHLKEMGGHSSLPLAAAKTDDFHALMQKGFPGMADVMVMPVLSSANPETYAMISDPVAWVKKHIAAFAGDDKLGDDE